jgi:hypothetical protein
MGNVSNFTKAAQSEMSQNYLGENSPNLVTLIVQLSKG